MKFYGKSAESVQNLLKTDFCTGLNDKEAKTRLRHYGSNMIFNLESPSPSKVMYKLIYDPVSILLLVSALVCFTYSSFAAAGVILTVWIFNNLSTLVAYYRSEAVLHSVKSYGIPKAKVVRDGKLYLIDSRLLVPGDVVILEAGDIVCADCKLIKADKLSVYEYDICGLSEPQSKFVSDDNDAVTLSQMHGMVFASSSIVSGNGTGVVTATSQNTEIVSTAGKIPLQSKDRSELFTDVKKQCRRWSIFSALTVTLLFVVKLLVFPSDIFGSFMIVVALLGASMTESLLPLTQIVVARALAHNAKALGEGRSVIKNLGSIESLRDMSYLIITPEIIEDETDRTLDFLRSSGVKTIVAAQKKIAFSLATKLGVSISVDLGEVIQLREGLSVFISDNIKNTIDLISFLKKKKYKVGGLTTRLDHIRMLRSVDVAFTYGNFRFKTNKMSKIPLEGAKENQNEILSRISDVLCEKGLLSVFNASRCCLDIYSSVKYAASYLLTMQLFRGAVSAFTLFTNERSIYFEDILISGMVVDLISVFAFSFFDFDHLTRQRASFKHELISSSVTASYLLLFIMISRNLTNLSFLSFLGLNSRALTVSVLILYPLISFMLDLKCKKTKKYTTTLLVVSIITILMMFTLCSKPISILFELAITWQMLLISVLLIISVHMASRFTSKIFCPIPADKFSN